MGDALFIGVDIGTQGVKAAMYDRQGRLAKEAFRKSDLKRPSAGAVEEDPEFQLASVCQTVAECACAAPRGAAVKGISIDGQMAGIIGVGEDGKNVTPYDSWLDTRCAPWITFLQKEAGAEIVRKSGGPPSFNHGPKIMWWKNERPEVFRRIRAFVQPGGYAAMRLTGKNGSEAFIDSSYLHFSGFADSRAGSWDAELCRRFGVDKAMLPRIVAPHEVVGELTAEMAKLCGLPAGVAVVAGCGDTAASFLSCGATRPGICVDVAGTASVFACTVTDFKVDEKDMVLSCGRSAVPGLWHPYAYINGGGMNLEWFKEQTRFAALISNALNAAAAAIQPSAEDPFFVPHLGGRVSPGQPLLRGAWVGLTWSHGMGHLYRAVLEGVALEYGIYLEMPRVPVWSGQGHGGARHRRRGKERRVEQHQGGRARRPHRADPRCRRRAAWLRAACRVRRRRHQGPGRNGVGMGPHRRRDRARPIEDRPWPLARGALYGTA